MNTRRLVPYLVAGAIALSLSACQKNFGSAHVSGSSGQPPAVLVQGRPHTAQKRDAIRKINVLTESMAAYRSIFGSAAKPSDMKLAKDIEATLLRLRKDAQRDRNRRTRLPAILRAADSLCNLAGASELSHAIAVKFDMLEASVYSRVIDLQSAAEGRANKEAIKLSERAWDSYIGATDIYSRKKQGAPGWGADAVDAMLRLYDAAWLSNEAESILSGTTKK